MERVFATYNVTSDTEGISGTVIESNYKAIEHKAQLLTLCDTRSNIERIFVDTGIVTKTNVEGIVEIRLSKLTSTLQLQIVTTSRYACEEVLQAS